MPEGDTIRRLADKIQRRFAGQTCQRCVTRDPRLVGVDFAGRVLVGADAFGKHLLLRFDDGRTLHAHLLMTGSWTVGPVATEPAWRRRIELWMQDRLLLMDIHITPQGAPKTTVLNNAAGQGCPRPHATWPVRCGGPVHAAHATTG